MHTVVGRVNGPRSGAVAGGAHAGGGFSLGLTSRQKMAAPDREGDTSVVTRTRTEKKLERPKLYRVLLHNDDYTTREFVVWILEVVFHRSEVESVQIMLHVHNNGVGVAGVYPFDVAQAKVEKVLELAEQNEFPLLSTLEPE